MKQKNLHEIIRTFDSTNTDYSAIVYAGIGGNPYAIAEITGGQNAISFEIASKWWGVVARLFGSSAGVGVAGGAGAASRMAFAIITAHQQHLCFYILKKWSMSLLVEQKVIVPYNDILNTKLSKSLIGINLKMSLNSGGKKHTLKITIASNAAAIGNQKQNIDKLIEHLDKATA